MGRVLMGLSSEDPLEVVKEESVEDAYETSCKPPLGIIQNLAGGAAKYLQLGGVTMKPSQSMFSSHGYVTGTTAPWFNSKPSVASAQLTIFYGGTVNVYNDISPEKAEAIMLLAGQFSSHGIYKSQARSQIHISYPGKEDNVQPSDNGLATHGIPSPVSVCSKSNSEAKLIGFSGSPIANFELDPPKVVGSIGSLAATTMIQSGISDKLTQYQYGTHFLDAVVDGMLNYPFYGEKELAIPQSRKASLARFLEKRKERMMNSAPYNLCKNSSETGTTSVSDGATSSISIAIGKESI